MITYTNVRNHCGRLCDPTTYKQTVQEALTSLLVFELGYGGLVKVIEDTRLTVRTRVMSAVDDVTWQGSIDEMRPLLQIAACWSLVAKSDGSIVNGSDCAKILAATGGKPLFVVTLSGIMIGTRRALTALIAACCTEIDDAQFIANVYQRRVDHYRAINTERPEQQTLRDLITCWVLALEEKRPTIEVVRELIEEIHA